jgi:hypothetical protein
MGGVRSIHQHPRRLPLAKQAEVSEMLDYMQREGVIEESDNPWPSPVVLVREKWGTPFLSGLQEIKRYHKERLFSSAPD